MENPVLKKKKPGEYFVPLALGMLVVFSFGVMIPWLGYGFDEWHFIYYSTRGIQGLENLFHYDGHPQALWSYILSFNILGYSPFVWHLYSLFFRFLAILSFWLCLREIWPDNHRQNFLVAATFAVYPVFTLQVFPISYFEIWIGYSLLFLSFYFNVLAIKRGRKEFGLLAILFALGHVFTREYAWFVELMRPVFIWFVLPEGYKIQNKIRQLVRLWLPFFIIFFSALIWRGFFYTPLRKYFLVDENLFTNPLGVMIGWLINLIPDLSIVLVSSWFKTFDPNYLYLLRPLNIILLLLMIFLTISGGKFVQRLDFSSQNSEKWAFQAVFLGLPSLLFGILPFYLASYSLHLTETPHNSRLTIGMLPGAALIFVAIMEKLISSPNLKAWMMAFLLSLSVGWHIRYTNDYRKIWEYQSNLLEQLTWRVPGIEKNTALYVLQSSLPETDIPDARIVYADFSLSMALNSIYQVDPIPSDNRLSYWFYTYTNSVDLVSEDTLYSEHATTFFEGNKTDSLFVYYDPSNDRCLHLITSADLNYKQYPEEVKKVANHSSIKSVLPVTTQNLKLKNQILNTQNQDWCFYYQKADFAKQFGRWDEIPGLWQAVVENELRTSFGVEYLPFIEGFARLGDWETAQEITFASNRVSKAMDSALCPLWTDLKATTSASKEKEEVIRQVWDKLGCEAP